MTKKTKKSAQSAQDRRQHLVMMILGCQQRSIFGPGASPENRYSGL